MLPRGRGQYCHNNSLIALQTESLKIFQPEISPSLRSVILIFDIAIMAQTQLTPVHFFSHGSTMMLGEESASATYWKKCGDAALANGIKHVVMMVRSNNITSPLNKFKAYSKLGRTLGNSR
jgi:NADH dehydrogenase FAD-containing subunit